MKKLNNKGFAISTLLYGILTMIILILMLLLNIMRSAHNKSININDNLSYYMNKCISRQISLEKCYQEYNSNPSSVHDCGEEYDRYSVCLGLGSFSYVSSKSAGFLKDIIFDNADSKEKGLVIDKTTRESNRYVFAGANPNNYIKFGNKEGRIISIESGGAVKVLLTDELITSELDKKNISEATDGSTTNSMARWTSSTLYNSLKARFNSMEYTSKMTKSKFYTGIVYASSNNTEEALATMREEYVQEKFGIISLDDYLKASSASNCNLSSKDTSIITTFANCSKQNWLNNAGKFWTSNLYNDLDNYATYSSSGIEQTRATTTGINSYMVIVLKDNITAGVTATGEKSNPYIVELR